MNERRKEFIELGRRFRELKADAKVEEIAFESYSRDWLTPEPSFDWTALLKFRRIVVLGEPGSGKTWELQNRAALLRGQGQFALFIRLDLLGGQPMSAALRQEEFEAFQRWLRTRDDGTFFLDSVDEAKFHNVSDFHAALDKFADAVGPDRLARTRIVLSSRITEWQPASDAYEFNLRFPQPNLPLGRKDNQTQSAERPKLLVVHLEPLDRTQVQTFAVSHGVSNGETFVAALDQAHAWEFARRPLDVADLVAFWKERGRIGSLTELVEFDIESKLRSRTDRIDFPLSKTDAREGATWLAAASAFTRRFTFWVPEDLSRDTDSLDTRSCVPDTWSDEKLRALCNRPIFDGASYGRFRFHHRRVGEYLAAAWIAARMREGCPELELQRVLFDCVREHQILRPSMAPIAAWLCIGNEQWNRFVRTWVLGAAPGLHLNYGDPAQLSTEYKRLVLATLAKMSRGRRRIWLVTSYECLRRLADPMLALDISALIRDKGLAVDLRIEMVDLVRHGRLASCLEAIIAVLNDPSESDELQVYAAAAVGSLNDRASCQRLAEIAQSRTTLSNRFCAELIQVLYPKWIGGREVAALLEQVQTEERLEIDLLSHFLSHLEEALTPSNADELLGPLIALIEQPPFVTHGQEQLPVSAKFFWIGRLFPKIVTVLVGKPSLNDDEVRVTAQALVLLGYARECHELYHEDFNALNIATTRHFAVRQKCFWLLAEDYRKRHREEPTRAMQVFNHWEVLRVVPEDLGWLICDAEQRAESKDRVLALHVALEVWSKHGRSRSTLRKIQRTAKGDENLVKICRTAVSAVRFLPLKRLWSRFVEHRIAESWWWRQHFQKLRWKWLQLRSRMLLLWNAKALASGKPAGWLARLCRHADEKNSTKWTPRTWEDLEKKQGKWIARAAQRGCKASWRRFRPPLPHEKENPRQTQNGVVIGLAGLQLEIDDGELQFPNLNLDEAHLAARYAVNELNGFADWLPDLALAHPGSVSDVLNDCIRGEWECPADREDVHDVLQRLTWNGEPFLGFVCPTILRLLRKGDPPNATVLRSAITLLMHQSSPHVEELAQFARERATYLANPSALWFAVWLQVDALPAIAKLVEILTPDRQGDDLIIRICAWLHGQRGDQYPLLRHPDYLKPEALVQLIPIVYGHVRIEEDIDRSGSAYTPEARDAAQDFRGTLVDLLSRSHERSASDALRLVANEPALAPARDWVLKLLDDRLERESDLLPWTPNDLKAFAREHEVDPKNDRELFAIAVKRLLQLKFDVEQSDNSLRDELHRESKELHFRRWIARRVNERSRNRYSIPQEPEIDLQQRPDLRFLRPGMGPVSVEAKLADLGWSISDLLESLEMQLVGQYLRDHQSRYGIYVVGYLGLQQHWKDPTSGKKLTFSELTELLKARAKQLVDLNPKIGELAVVEIDFREPNRA